MRGREKGRERELATQVNMTVGHVCQLSVEWHRLGSGRVVWKSLADWQLVEAL